MWLVYVIAKENIIKISCYDHVIQYVASEHNNYYSICCVVVWYSSQVKVERVILVIIGVVIVTFTSYSHICLPIICCVPNPNLPL